MDNQSSQLSNHVADHQPSPDMPVLQAGLVEGVGGLLGLGVLAIVGYAVFRPTFLIPDPNEALIVRGARGTKVVHDRGVFLFGARNITRVSLNKNEVTVNMSGGSEPVRTADFFKANIPVTVDVAVAKNEQSILTAAERLTKNNRVDDNAIKEAADAQLKDAIRGAAKEMTLDQIDRDKKGFESRVRAAIQEDLTGYGLVVISISIKEITECNRYDPNDVLDAQALENRTKTTEEAKRAKERLEKETEAINREIRLQTECRVLGYQLEEEKAKAQNKIETEKLQPTLRTLNCHILLFVIICWNLSAVFGFFSLISSRLSIFREKLEAFLSECQ